MITLILFLSIRSSICKIAEVLVPLYSLLDPPWNAWNLFIERILLVWSKFKDLPGVPLSFSGKKTPCSDVKEMWKRFRAVMGRVFAISDIHVDYKDNQEFVKEWSPAKYRNDTLVLAGDVSDSLELLESILKHLTSVFAKVFFVPGNHELWLRRNDLNKYKNSIEKFYRILTMCCHLGVSTKPEKVNTSDGKHIWIVPLFSWYVTPDDASVGSLYVKSSDPQVDKDSKILWMDNHLCRWPDWSDASSVSDYFVEMNQDRVHWSYDAPVISFSHFLPRGDLIMPNDEEMVAVKKERKNLGLDESAILTLPKFNFTMYAGDSKLESQIRKMGSAIHVYGHQHRNRDRNIDSVRYVSHCLGGKKEQEQGLMWGMFHWNGPKQIWP